ncbi:MAG: hypothetical protein ACOZB0_10105 [Pseudomonadota bacterium]
MTPESQVLPLASVHAGMHLAEPVRDRQGNLMLAAGTELTAPHIAALARRGIASVLILPERIPPSDQERAAMRQATEARLRHIFRKSLDAPASAALFEVLLAYRLDPLAATPPGTDPTS